jgi:hypothetical protein
MSDAVLSAEEILIKLDISMYLTLCVPSTDYISLEISALKLRSSQLINIVFLSIDGTRYDILMFTGKNRLTY